MREKLIELLICADDHCNEICNEGCNVCKYNGDVDCDYNAHADYLIANGVRVSNYGKMEHHFHEVWVSVDERLPEESGDYLAYCGNGYIGLMPYSTQYKLFNAFDGCGTKHAIAVTHWMPLPQPPEGV